MLLGGIRLEIYSARRRSPFRKAEPAAAHEQILRSDYAYPLPVMSGAENIFNMNILAPGDINPVSSRRRERQPFHDDVGGIIERNHMSPLAPDVALGIKIVFLEHFQRRSRHSPHLNIGDVHSFEHHVIALAERSGHRPYPHVLTEYQLQIGTQFHRFNAPIAF